MFRKNPTATDLKNSDLQDKYVAESYRLRRDGLFDGSYEPWRSRRLAKIVSIYGSEHLATLRVLEVGAGHADIGASLAALGASVLSLEGRAENVQFAQIKHRKVPGLEIRRFDLEEDHFDFGIFDVVVHMGLLYHLSDPALHLAQIQKVSGDILLESLVLDSSDEYLCESVPEDATDNQMSLHGTGSRFSPNFVERIASELGFDITRFVDADANSDEHIYDWEPGALKPMRTWGRRRLWRVTSKPDSTESIDSRTDAS